MRVPVSFNPGDYNKIANNSFAFGATYTDENASGDPIQLPFLPSEPTKVGAKLTSPSAGTFAIGDFIWEDINKDGIQGASEPGINGITVNLYKDGETSPSAFTITANNFDGKPGYYNFPNLDNGKYHVEFVMPKDYFITNLNATGGALDSDFELSGSAMDRKYIATVTLSGSDCLDIDAGIYRLGSIGDMVFNDRNFNAVYNNSIDKGVSGASVKLYRITGGGVTEGATYWNGTGFVSTTAIITDSTGKYKFDGLDPGEYIVEFTMPNDSFKFVTPGSIDRADNDSNVQTNSTASGTTVGRTEKVELKSGENRVDIDAGIYLGQIGDRVWHDRNGNGIQDVGEPGINGVTVQLYNSDGTTLAKDAFGNTVAAVTTSATGGLDGIYYFNDLGAGDYVVKFITPAGYNITKKNATTSALDSDADPKTGLTSKVTLTAGSQDITVDCGLYNFVSIGDFVFNDLNANGIQDGGEGGITGVAVTLYRVTTGGVTIPATYWDGSPVQDIITTGSGFYLFDRIDPGEYRVQFKTTDSAFMATKANVGGNDTKDSDGIPTTTNYSVVLTDSYKLDSGDSNPNVDQGFFLIQPGIEIEKTVYANTDGGIGTGTHLIARKAGTPLTYMFKITNTGNTYLSDIEIDDIQLGITLGGMKIKSGSLPLAPNATLVAYYETTLTNDIKNTAVTTGTAVYDATGTAIPGMVKPTDSVWQKQGP